MYLSRLILNPRSRQVRSELARPYEMHRTLLRAFPTGKVHTGRTEDDASGLLFRVEEDARTGRLQLLAQSQLPPDWAFLAAGDYLLPALADNPGTREVALQLHPAQLLAFRLRANPTKRLSAGKGAKGKRVGIYEEEAQLAWLARKGTQHGFHLLQAQVSRDGKFKQDQAVQAENGVHDLELLSVQFDGVLQVSDPAALVRSVAAGIGSGKAFGFGLLSLARPN
ncbi:MAG: type I-E CRISPR-associated protein Cas6/Cse3/CasE [Caldilineaceae bacterium]